MNILERLETRPFSVIGHRGAGGRFPENTLKAIEYAIEIGVDIVEVDVRSTRDGELVVFHDPDLKRLFGIDKKVRDLEYRWIRENLRLGDQYIPLLSEVLDLIGDRVGLFIEVKEPDTVEKIVEMVEEYGLVDSIALISFYDEALKHVRRLSGNIVTGLIYFRPPGRLFDAKKLGASIVLPRYSIATRKANDYAHRLGLKVVVWTVNDPGLVVEMFRRNVDGIASDYPDMVLRVRGELVSGQ